MSFLELLLAVLLGDQIAAQNLQPTVPRPDVLPQIGGAVSALCVGWIARRTAVALIEGQKARVRTFKARGHADFEVTDREMDEGAIRERQQWFGAYLSLRARMTVETVLIDGVLDRLGEVGFEFRRGDRNPVEEQAEIEGVFGVERVAQLAHHAQPVGGVAGEQIGIHRQGGFELGQGEGVAQAEQFDAVAQHVEGAALVEGGPQPVE
jgi:hypothetical protein